MTGISDIPIEGIGQDSFGLRRYVKGLAGYILKCDTPTTIAVQGDWGCGKTSMLNMIREELGDKVKSIWFNTWQYSKFNLDDRLSLSLLTHLYKSIDSEAESGSNKVMKKLSALLRAGAKVGTYFIDGMGAQKFADDIGNVIDNGFKGSNDDVISVIEELKNDYQKKINDIYNRTGKRVVVFIDDLDRLAPSRAVDLMEILKLFLDCRNCVYVLAIDYEVVTRGISEKYGKDFGEKQGKKFFDKIIQVPFFVPVEQYNVTPYIKQSLPENIKLNDEEIEQFVRMIKYSVGCNPRSMKRLFNVFMLLTMINSDRGFDKDSALPRMLFAILCLQLSMQEVYKYLVENDRKLTSEDFKKFAEMPDAENTETSETVEKINNIIEQNELNYTNTWALLSELASIVLEGEKSGDNGNIAKLESILSISSSTNNTGVNSNGGVVELTGNKKIKKWINNTDVTYKILTVRSEFHIGFGKPITLVCNGVSYPVKMHSKTKGRIDGLGKFYADTGIKQGDCCLLEYLYDKAEVICTIISNRAEYKNNT